ncbi:polysaccharide lyase 6 family protein [Lutibacter sp.]|uniref:polysaccharide lyase 6 family protein n=1 Tax=Lutibacter sp. TaxID=1925666 RepID=UPI0025C6FAD6|nr:polysaccharide lyase 6 family protein [Lutibacter sp.]MCF6181284.1 polysaccharide lyase 6 family protein [Lutibacter sp.]
MIAKKIILFAVLISIYSQLIAQTSYLNKRILVENVSAFNNAIKVATPGTQIILKNGVWKDVHLKIEGIGTKLDSIVIKAENEGKVILTGNSSIKISGKYIKVQGFWFKNGTPKSKSVIEFKKDKQNAAYNCRLTNCTISNYNPQDKSIESHWIELWGKNNRVDHNNFTGKTNAGTTLIVWLKGQENTENHHLIDHNFFGYRPNLGENGSETIRIGTSTNSLLSSKTTVEFNTFKNCNGEIEIISNKSCDNIYKNNLFIESEGTLTLRHGNRALVENNVFIGNNNPKVGGIRIINEGHKIQNNVLINVVGKNYRSPITIMNGVPNSPLNRYSQVKNVTIQNNTLINCSPMVFGAGKDSEKSLTAVNTTFANNLITNTTNTSVLEEQDAISGIQFIGNIVDSDSSVNPAQFTKINIVWNLLKGLPMPSISNDEMKKNSKKISVSPKYDCTNSERIDFVAGAFNLDNKKLPLAILAKTGPSWTPIISKIIEKVQNPSEINVKPGIRTLEKALKKASNNSSLILSSGTYFIKKTMKINGNIHIKALDTIAKVILKSANDLEKGLLYFFRMNENSSLHLDNISFDGGYKSPVKYAIVSPDEQKPNSYSVFVKNCNFKNFSNSNGAVFKAYQGAFADTLSILNSTIENCYRGLNISYEKSLAGKTNVKNIIIKNTIFKNIDEFAINYYRNNINPLTSGGNLIVDHCIFSNVYNKEKGYTIKIKGIDKVKITNSVFENSYQIKDFISLNGITNMIKNCLVYMNGNIKTSNNATKDNIIFKSPKWDNHKLFIPKKKSILLKENNGIGRIGLTQNKKE